LLPAGDVTTLPFLVLYTLATPAANESVNKSPGSNFLTSAQHRHGFDMVVHV